MNKAEMIDEISTKAKLSKADAGRALEAVLEAIVDGMKQGQSTTLAGFGTFVVRERAARTGRNPRTREEISIAAAKVPAFKPSKALKDALN
ncbi:MAG: HU family DNA-binding protein [Candidatus Eutrophobiaceae bacterium]